MKHQNEVYVADFETSHEVKKDGRHYSWVWCAGYQRLFSERKDALKIFGTIADFIESLLQNDTKKVYFHNLKFDGQFLLSYFLYKKYTYNEDLNQDKQLSYIIDRTGTFYMLTVTFLNAKGKLKRCRFIDSMKIYPYSLKVLAKQMKMSESKGDMDYEKVRYPNHKLTPTEYDYFRRDIAILKIAMETAYNNGYTKLTIGANAMEQYKNSIGTPTKQGKYIFRHLFPRLDEEIDTYLRKAYKGGYCYCNNKFANKITPIHSYDINSMYPTQLKEQPMPYGMPIHFNGKWRKKENRVCVQHIKCRFFIKPRHLPTIQLKHTRIFNENEWIENSPQQMNLYLTNIDLDLFFKHYKVIDLEYIDGYEFYTHTGLFSKYIDYWYGIKENATDPGLRLFAKLFLNNLYGKYGTNPKRVSLRYQLTDGIITRSENVEEECESVYIPVAIFTTSYARCYLITQAQNNYDIFAYADTDSLHLIKPTENLPIDNKKLGYFKYEYYGKVKHLKQKTYLCFVEKENKNGVWYDVNEYKLTCAGMNRDLLDKEHCKIDFNTFKLGAEFPKLKTHRAIGGVYLKKELHTIK